MIWIYTKEWSFEFHNLKKMIKKWTMDNYDFIVFSCGIVFFFLTLIYITHD